MKNGPIVIYFFQDGGRQPSGFVESAFLDDPQRVVGGLYHCAKFGCITAVAFESMEVSIFYTFGLKNPISPKNGFWGGGI